MKIIINEQLKKNKLSRYELAKRIGITYPTVTRLYNGNTTSIRLDILENLCKEFKCTPNDILTSDDPQMRRLLLLSHPKEITSDDSEFSNHIEGDGDE